MRLPINQKIVHVIFTSRIILNNINTNLGFYASQTMILICYLSQFSI